MNGFEDLQKVGRDGMDRAVQSFSAFGRGWQALATDTAGYSKQAFEDGAAHLEKLIAVNSPDVAVAAQLEFLQASSAKAIEQAARFGDLSFGLLKDAAKPFEGFAPTTVK